MGIPLPAPPRPMMVGLMGLSAVAIAVGRRDDRPAAPRAPAAVRYAVVDAHLLGRDCGPPWLLDAERGRLVRLGLPGAGALSHASCSPWRDDWGNWQLVGRSHECAGRGTDRVACGFGLARWTFPGGRVLDRVDAEVVPVGPPAWLPGTAAGVVFAAGDGRLYRFAFEGMHGPDGTAGEPDSEPRPLAWRVAPPGRGPILLADPSRPTDPRLGDRLLVALSTTESGGEAPVWEVWWLRLDAEATAIVAAGRLTRPDTERRHERCPVLAAGPEGGLVLAYLAQRPGACGAELRLAPVRVEPATGVPAVGPGEAVTSVDDVVPTPPAFSADGRWVSCVVRPPGAAPAVRRLEVVAPRVAPGAGRPEARGS